MRLYKSTWSKITIQHSYSFLIQTNQLCDNTRHNHAAYNTLYSTQSPPWEVFCSLVWKYELLSAVTYMSLHFCAVGVYLSGCVQQSFKNYVLELFYLWCITQCRAELKMNNCIACNDFIFHLFPILNCTSLWKMTVDHYIKWLLVSRCGCDNKNHRVTQHFDLT